MVSVGLFLLQNLVSVEIIPVQKAIFLRLTTQITMMLTHTVCGLSLYHMVTFF